MNNNYYNTIVSVIIPVYNAAKYISSTIDSALNQTYQDIEIILVDDCSSDQSPIIIKQYAVMHDNIIYHLQEKNCGAAVARNTALQIAKGRYVAFLDSDDIWYSKKVASQIDLMNKKNAAICFTAIEIIDEEGNSLKGKREVREKINYNFLLKNTMIATSSVIVDRNMIGEFQMPLRKSGQDYATWLQLMRNGTEAFGINEVLVKYRIRSNSLSSNKLRSIKNVWDIQTKYEGINPVFVTFHTACFILNAMKKKLL